MNQYRIHRVSKLTGLSRDVIRIWERRYQFIKPERGPNRYRLYNDDDVALLRYLKRTMDEGTSIGELGAIGREGLMARVRAEKLEQLGPIAPFERLLSELLRALEPLDPEAFERRLNGAIAVIPFEEALHGILLPLQERVGELWHQSSLDISVEHYVTKQVQQKLFAAMNQLRIIDAGPTVMVGCPPGELHEVAAQAVAYLARGRGCSVAYLGPNLPVHSLASICQKVEADLLVLSYTGADLDGEGDGWIPDMNRLVSPVCPIWIGGRGTENLQDQLKKNRFQVIGSILEFEHRIHRMISKFNTDTF